MSKPKASNLFNVLSELPETLLSELFEDAIAQDLREGEALFRAGDLDRACDFATRPSPLGDAFEALVRQRLFVATGLCLIWATGIEARLFYLQVQKHGDLQARAERQQMRTIDVSAKPRAVPDLKTSPSTLGFFEASRSAFRHPSNVRIKGRMETCGDKKSFGNSAQRSG